MVAVGRAQMADHAETMSLEHFVWRCLDRFQLLRPEAEVGLNLASADAGMPILVPSGLQHALLNLLNNALDASAQRDSAQVEFSARRGARTLEFAVRDHGPGFTDRGRASDTLGVSGKDHGLGIGLALAEATAERLGGLLDAGDARDGGAEIRLRLPLSAVQPERRGRPLLAGAT
jgi:two-component system sensor histidine kinase RegB